MAVLLLPDEISFDPVILQDKILMPSTPSTWRRWVSQ